MYEKQTWKTGDVITESKLNHMEDGIADSGGSGGGIMYVQISETETEYTLDKTWNEIMNAVNNGMYCVAVKSDANVNIKEFYGLSEMFSSEHEDEYSVAFGSGAASYTYESDNPDEVLAKSKGTPK